MAKYFIEDTTLTAMADKIRALTGNTGSLTPAQMTTEVQEAKEDVDSAMDALETLGITIPEGSDIGDLAGLVGEVESGIDTSDATATSADILANKTAYVDGEKITGSIATKTSSNLSASGATVTVPAGYYASQATKSVATATQATPSVSVSSSGLITASATQSAGYVSAGTKSGTKQLTTQAAKTVTPTTSNQTAVSSGRYTTGAVTVKGDSNLVAGNIKKGVSIFGVSGSLESGTNTSDATATAGDIMSGKTAYVSSGKTTGTFTLDSEISTQENLISTIKTALQNKSAGGGGSVETCALSFTMSGGTGAETLDVVYMDGDFNYQHNTSLNIGGSVTVLKNSLICFLGGGILQGTFSDSNNIEGISGSASSGYRLLYIKGDVTFTGMSMND